MSRESAKKKTNPIFYVFTNGITEQHYYNSFKRIHRLGNVTIKIKNTSTDPKSLISYSKRYFRHERMTKKDYDKAFISFDKDDFDQKYLEDIFNIADKENIGIIFSNECFEVWLLLHYKKLSKQYSRLELFKELEDATGCSNWKDNKANCVLIERIASNFEKAKSNFSSIEENQPFKNPYFSYNTFLEVFSKRKC